MIDFIEIVVFFLGVFSIPAYVTCLGEFRTFPFFAHTQKNEINAAHNMRLVSVITTGISASYGLALFGHMIGFGGLETMFTQQRLMFFLMFGIVSLAFSLNSKRLDNQIYREIQQYDDLHDESFKIARERIRKEGQIRKMLTRTTEEKTGRAEKEQRRLDKDIQRNYQMEQRLEKKDQELALLKKRLSEAEKVKQKTDLGIDMTSHQIVATEKEIARLEGETTQLDKKLSKLNKTLKESLAVLAPLLEESERKEKDLDRRSKEFQKVSKLITETKRATESLAKDIVNVEKQLSKLIPEGEEAERKLAVVRQHLEKLAKQKKDLEKVINDRNIQQLSGEEKYIEIKLLRKSIEKAVQKEKPEAGGRIFE